MFFPFRILVLSLLVLPPPLLPQTLAAVVVVVIVVVGVVVGVVIAAADLTAVYQDSLQALSAAKMKFAFLPAVAGVVHLFVLIPPGTVPIEVASLLLHRT